MAHRIEKDEPVGEALLRLLRADLAKAVADLRREGSRDECVHRARQRLKRARSLVRLMKPVLGDATHDIRNDLRAAAELLAGARDADAAAASARDLNAATGGEAGFGRVVAVLDRSAEAAHRFATPIDAVVERLAAAGEHLQGLEAPADGDRLFDRSTAKAYKSGRKAMRRARSRLATPDLHGWRKDVKTLWHLLRLGRRRLPRRARPMAARLSRLGDVLGLDHDHAMLAERLALSPEADPALMRQLAAIALERRKLEAEAFAIGAKVYREKPRRFAGRMQLR